MPTVTDRSAEAPGRARAWGWVAHLEGGGTTPWSAWPVADADALAAAPWLPGAQQLELLRRLNQVGRPDPELVRRVLAAPALGRGRHDIDLVGVARSGDFGPRPVDPADLGDEELLRVAVGLVAEDVTHDSSADSRGKPDSGPQTNRRRRLVRTHYRLAGDPELAGPMRAALVAGGRPPGGSGTLALVLGADLATMFGHAWTSGAFAEGGPSWPDFLDLWRERGGVPRRIDLPAIADHRRAHPETGRVEVVLDVRRVPGLLRLRRARRPATGGPPLPLAAVDLARRTATALGLMVPAEERATLLTERLRPRLEQARGLGPVVPEQHLGWVTERAVRMRDRLVRDGYPIQGDPDLLLPHPDAQPPSAEPDPLGLALVLLLGGLDPTNPGNPGGRT